MDKLLKLDFFAGKKTYVLLGIGAAVLVGSLLTGVDIACELARVGAEAVCGPVDSAETLRNLYALIAAVLMRKGIG